MWDKFIQLVKLLLGNAWNRVAVLLIFGGVASINGILQYIIPAIAKHFGQVVTIPDTPLWVSFALIVLGISVLVGGRLLPERNSSLSSDDKQFIAELKDIAQQRTSPAPDALTHFLDRAPTMNFSDPQLATHFDALRHEAQTLQQAREPSVAAGVVPSEEKTSEIESRFNEELKEFLKDAGVAAVKDAVTMVVPGEHVSRLLITQIDKQWAKRKQAKEDKQANKE